MSEIIVSLTSFPMRIGGIHHTLKSIFEQSRHPDKVVLCLCETEFPNKEADLPVTLEPYILDGLEILWVSDNLKPHKKYFYTMQKYPQAAIITLDDDIIYPKFIVERLVESYQRFPHCVSAVRAHLMRFSESGELAPYREWGNWSQEYINRPCFALFPTGGAGALYPPGEYRKHFLDKDAIRTLCLDADDVWMKFIELKCGIPVVVPPNSKYTLQYVDGSQENALFNTNMSDGGNDSQIARMVEYCSQDWHGDKPFLEWLYNSTQEAEIQSDEVLSPVKVRCEHAPIVSVILPVHNVAPYLDECLSSIEKQTIRDVEIICVDDGSTDNSGDILRAHAAADDRYGIIYQIKHGAGHARNRGLEVARGEYVLFHDPDDFCDLKLLEDAVDCARCSDSDVVLYGRYIYNSAKKKIEGRSLFSKEIAALADGFSYSDVPHLLLSNFGFTPWNKVIRRNFLMENGISFQEIPRNNDVYFSSAVMLAAKRISVLNKPYYYYRVNREGGLQATVDDTPLSELDALLAVRDGIMRFGDMSLFRNSFVRMAFIECINKLQAFTGSKAFRIFYASLREGGFKALGIDDSVAPDIGYSQYMMYSMIMRNAEPTEFLLSVLKQKKMVEGKLRAQLFGAQNSIGTHLPIVKLIERFASWRIDCISEACQKINCITSSEGVEVSVPNWIASQGMAGCVLTGMVSSARVVLQCGGGDLCLSFRAPDVKDTAQNKRIDFIIDYCSIKINGEELLAASKEITYSTTLKKHITLADNAEVTIDIVTKPHVYAQADLIARLRRANILGFTGQEELETAVQDSRMWRYVREHNESERLRLGTVNLKKMLEARKVDIAWLQKQRKALMAEVDLLKNKLEAKESAVKSRL